MFGAAPQKTNRVAALRRKGFKGNIAVMKTPYLARTYRASTKWADEQSFQVMLEETDLWITCLKDVPADLPQRILSFVRELRAQIKSWGQFCPEFMHSLVPVSTGPEAPEIARKMAEAARAAGVGPMAAVAGAIAEAVAEKFSKYSQEFLVENGGDIFMYSSRARVVALLADPECGGHFGLKFAAKDFPLSVCSSSSSIGHSLSLGRGELAAALSKSGALADAFATACCNLLKSPEDVQRVLDTAARHPGIEGIFVQGCGRMGAWGAVELEILG